MDVKPFDIRITKGATEYDFVLAQDDKGQKQISVKDTKILPPMFTSDRPLNAHIPPEYEEQIVHNYFYAGAGEENFEHGRMYFKGPADTRVKGHVVTPPDIAKCTITVPASTTVYALRNAGAEEGATTGWTASATPAGTALTADGAVKNSGSYSLKYANAGGAGNAGTYYVYQDFYDYASWQGKALTVSAYLKSGSADMDIYLTVDDGVGTTSSTAVTNGGFTLKSVTHTVNAAATRVRIEAKIVIRINGNVYMDDVTITTTSTMTGSVVAIEDFAGYPYAASGFSLLKWDGTDWDAIATFGTTITTLKTWGDYLFIAQSASDYYWYYNGTTFTKSTLSTGKMKYLSTVAGTLWGSSSDYEVKSSTNPLNGGSWTAATTIVNSNKDITAMVSHDDMVTIGCQDGFYQINSDGDVVSLLPDLVTEAHTKTCRGYSHWRGNFYVASGYNSFREYDYGDSTISTISPKEYLPNQTEFDGFVMASAGDDSWLYVAIDYGTKAEILAGKWLNIMDQNNDYITDWRWHHLLEQTLTNSSDNVQCMKVSTLPSARNLFIGCASTTDGIYKIDLDTNHETSAILETPWHEGKYKHILKTFTSLSLKTDNLASGKTITVKYKKENDSSWTTLGSALTSDSDTTLYFPVHVTSKKLQLQFNFSSDSATAYPDLLGYTLRCVSKPFDLDEGRLTINEKGEFSSWGSLETSGRHREFINYDKNYYNLVVLSESLTTAKYITIQYLLDDSVSGYETLTVPVTESPYQVIDLPENTTGKMIDFLFDLSSPSDTSMTAYIVNGKLRPNKRHEISAKVHIANGLSMNNGSVYRINPDNYMKILRDIRDEAWPVEVELYDGRKLTMTLETIDEQILYTPSHKTQEYIAEIYLLEADK